MSQKFESDDSQLQFIPKLCTNCRRKHRAKLSRCGSRRLPSSGVCRCASYTLSTGLHLTPSTFSKHFSTQCLNEKYDFPYPKKFPLSHRYQTGEYSWKYLEHKVSCESQSYLLGAFVHGVIQLQELRQITWYRQRSYTFDPNFL